MSLRRFAFLLWLFGVMELVAGGAPARADEPPILRVETGGHTAQVRQVLFTPDGQHLISVGKDKVVRYWNLTAGRQDGALRYQIGPGREGQLFSAALSRGLLAIGEGGASADILLFDLKTRQIVRRLTGHKYVVTALAFSPDGSRLVSSSGDGTIRLWDPQTGKPLWEKTVLKGNVKSYFFCAAFSPDGRSVAGGTEDGTVRVWDVAGKEARSTNAGQPVLCLAWSRDGTIAYGTRNGDVHLWNPATSAQETLRRQSDSVVCLAFSPDGQWLLSAGGEGGTDFSVRLWSVADRELVRAFKEHNTTLFSVAFSPDGKRAASADALGNIYVWDTATGRTQAQLKGTGAPVFSVAWAADGKKIAWGTAFGGPLEYAFDLLAAAPLPVGNPTDGWQRARKEQGGRRLSVEADGATVFLRDTGGKEITHIDSQPGDQVKCFTFTADGKVIVGSDLYLALWDVTGKATARQRLFEGHQGSILAVSVSPDGRYLASASADQTVRIWSLADSGHDAGGQKNVVEPLISLFRGSDGEWVAWNEHFGYYAASPNGDDIIGWQVNRGPDQAADFFTAFQFRSRFYRPDIVSRLLETGGVSEAAQKIAQLGLPRPDPTVTIPSELKSLPRVEIIAVEGANPQAEGYLATKSDVEVRVRVTDSDAADTTVQVSVNRPATSKRLREATATDRPEEKLLPATLTPGSNVISVVARNKAGESAPALATISYTPPGVPRSAKPRLYVLAVGVSAYADPNINSLRFAANDAQEIAAFYQSQAGKLFDHVEVKALTNNEATRHNVLESLTTLAANAGRDDFFILFVSSHGFQGKDGKSYYFAPTDTSLNDLDGSGVPWRVILDKLQNLKCGNVLLLLDHCYSGGVNLEIAHAEATRGIVPANEMGRALRQCNIFSFTGSLPDQLSWEDPEWKHGAFTYGLLEALRGRGSLSPGGPVTLTGTNSYLKERVPRLVEERLSQVQQPKLFIPLTLPDTVADTLPLADTR